MRILVIGAGGMAGHVVARYLEEQGHEIITIGSDSSWNEDYNFSITTMVGISLLDGIFDTERPEVVINCIGLLVKASSDDPTKAEQINTSFPHQLAYFCTLYHSKLIHISTDCVFDGSVGGHHETDTPTETNAYGSSKARGEIRHHPVHLTIRTSIVGPELKTNGTGLLDWFLRQSGDISGYTNAFWNGVTTLELAKYIQHVIEHPIAGLVHLTCAEDQLSKRYMLELFQLVFDNETVKINDTVLEKPINKTLVCTRDLGYGSKPFMQQLIELKDWYYCYGE